MKFLLLLILGSLLLSCNSRDEILTNSSIGGASLVYYNTGKIDSIACAPMNSKSSIQSLGNIDFRQADSLSITFTYQTCELTLSSLSSFEIYYLDAANTKQRILFSQFNNLSERLNLKVSSPKTNREVFCELKTSSSNGSPNCLLIKDLTIYKN